MVQALERKTEDNPRAPTQDGGAQKWFAVLCLFAIWFAWSGVLKGLAVMLPTLQNQFDTHTWLVGWMIALIDGVMDFVGPFASPLRGLFGARKIAVVCGIMVGVSFIASSFVSSLAAMALILIGFAAPGLGIANFITKELVGLHFRESSVRAFAVASLGVSLAFVIYAPLTQFLLDVYGWQGAMMLQGAILLHLAVCGALLKEKHGTPTYEYRPLQAVSLSEENEALDRERTCTCPRLATACRSIYNAFNLDLFTSPSYWLIVFITVCSTMNTAWVVFFASHTTTAKGYSLADTANFVAAFGAGKLAGNLVSCFFDRCPAIGAKAWMALGFAVISLCFLIDPWLTSYWSIMVYVFVYGCFHSVIVLLDVVTVSSISADQLGSAFGWIGLKTGIFRAAVVFFPGLIYDLQGSYTLAFMLMAGFNALALPALLALTWIQRRK